MVNGLAVVFLHLRGIAIGGATDDEPASVRGCAMALLAHPPGEPLVGGAAVCARLNPNEGDVGSCSPQPRLVVVGYEAFEVLAERRGELPGCGCGEALARGRNLASLSLSRDGLGEESFKVVGVRVHFGGWVGRRGIAAGDNCCIIVGECQRHYQTGAKKRPRLGGQRGTAGQPWLG